MSHLKIINAGYGLKRRRENVENQKGNVVAPEPLIEQYGADTARLFIMLQHHQSYHWNGQMRVLKDHIAS
jgi:Leucyl-tRNA synthetase